MPKVLRRWSTGCKICCYRTVAPRRGSKSMQGALPRGCKSLCISWELWGYCGNASLHMYEAASIKDVMSSIRHCSNRSRPVALGVCRPHTRSRGATELIFGNWHENRSRCATAWSCGCLLAGRGGIERELHHEPCSEILVVLANACHNA